MFSPTVIFMAEKEAMHVGHVQASETVPSDSSMRIPTGAGPYSLNQPLQQQVTCDDTTETTTTMATALKTTSGTAVSIQDVKNQLFALRMQSSFSGKAGSDNGNDNDYTVYSSSNYYGRTPHPSPQPRVPRHRQSRKRQRPVFQGRINAHQRRPLESVPEDREFQSSSHTIVTFSSMPALSLRYLSHLSENENNTESYHRHTNEDATSVGTTENAVEKSWQHVLARLKHMDSIFVTTMLEQLEKLGKDLNQQQMVLFERQADVLQMRMMIVDSMLDFEAKSNQIKADVSQLEQKEQRQKEEERNENQDGRIGQDGTSETPLCSNCHNDVLSSSESSIWGSCEESSTEDDVSDVDSTDLSVGSRPRIRKDNDINFVAIGQTHDQFQHLPLLRAQAHVVSPPPTTDMKISAPPTTALESWWSSPLASSSSPLCQYKKHYEEPELGKIVLPTKTRQTGEFVGNNIHPLIALDYRAFSGCVTGDLVESNRKIGKEKTIYNHFKAAAATTNAATQPSMEQPITSDDKQVGHYQSHFHHPITNTATIQSSSRKSMMVHNIYTVRVAIESPEAALEEFSINSEAKMTSKSL